LTGFDRRTFVPSLKIKDATIAYTDAGHGDPVLLLHGSASSRRMWQPLTERLAARYRVVAPDLVGYGESTPWHDRLQATDYDVVTTFARELGEPLHVVGHSYGGALALRAALASGSRVTSFVLVEPAAFLMLDRTADRAAFAEIEAVASRHLELVADGDLDACAAHFMGYWIGAATWAGMSPETRARLTATMPKIAAEFRLLFRDRERYDPRRVRAPALVVRGTRTTLAARAVADRLAATVPQAELVEVPGAGHMLTVTHAQEVNAAIAAHLAQVDAEAIFDAAA
jgi:pimeloyl-ACP methyl ester carboxylesterase